MKIIIPAGISNDLGPLVDALREAMEPIEWEQGAALPNSEDPVLLDLRGELPDLAELFANDSDQLLVVVGNDETMDRLKDLPGENPWAFLPADWPADATVKCLISKLDSWKRHVAVLDKERYDRTKSAGDLEIQLEDRAIELMVKNSELSRLSAFKAGVLNRLGDAERGFIADILRQVSEFEKLEDLAGPIKNIQNNLHHTAINIQHIFRSFDYWEKTERELEGRSILVVSATRKTRKVMVRALSETNATIHGVSTTEEALEILRDNFIDLLYVDWDNSALIEQAQAIRPDLKTVLLTGELLFEAHGPRMLDLPLQNVLITSDVSLTEDDEDPLLLRELTVTAGKLLGDNIFGIEKYLSWGSKIHETLVTNSDQRPEILDKIGEFAPQAGLRRSMAQNLETLTDEMLMNAIWDAPLDETGHHKYASLSRRKSIQLLPHECPILRYGADDRLVAVSVTDPFGGLERNHAYKYIVKCFAKKSDQIDTKRGGAGLGLYTAFLSVSSFVINVAPGFRTEVIGLLDNRLSRRKLSGRSRSYHFFVSDGPPQLARAKRG